MNFKSLAFCFFAVLFVFGLSACSGPQVTRLDPSEEVDFSGNWNDTDSRQVSSEMIMDSLSRPWVDEYIRKHNKKPRVIVGAVINKTDEHITTETFVC